MLTQHIRESLQVTPGPFPDFWVGPGDEATPRLSLTPPNTHLLISFSLPLQVIFRAIVGNR